MPTDKIKLSDQAVFGQFFEKTYVRLYRYLYGLTGGPAEEVEDLLADAYARAWSARYRFQGNSDAALSWLFRIAKNLVVDKTRKRQTIGDHQSIEAIALPAPNPGPETKIISGEQREIL